MRAGNSAAQVSTDAERALARERRRRARGASARSSRRNHGSIEVRSWIASTLVPRREQLEDRLEAVRARCAPARRAAPRSPTSSQARRLVELARAQRLGERLPERAPDRHRLADRLHVRRERRVGAGELLEREPRPLDDDVVDRRLEARRRDAGDVVVDLVERVADRQPRGDLGDREARSPCEASAEERDTRGFISITRISSVSRVDRELHVGAAGLDADRADHRDRLVAQLLVEAVGERLLRRDRDRVAGVHAHRVDVLDRADDHDVVGAVAHHLELELAPAEHRLVEQHLADRRGLDARARRSRANSSSVRAMPPPRPAERERRAHDARQADRGSASQRLRRPSWRSRCAASAGRRAPSPSPNSSRSSAHAIAS